jgi:hypothetical protein
MDPPSGRFSRNVFIPAEGLGVSFVSALKQKMSMVEKESDRLNSR